MNYYNRIYDLISADEILVESLEDQQRIDELLGRIGRALGGVFGGSKPASPYGGQWNPLRGKYEGGLGQAERLAAIKARVAAKKQTMGAAPTSAPKPTPVPTPTATPAPTAAPVPAPKIDKKAQAEADVARANQIAAKMQQRQARDIAAGADISTVGKQKGGMKALQQQQNQAGAGRYGRGGSMATQLAATKGQQPLAGAAKGARMGKMKDELAAKLAKQKAPQLASTYYGSIAKLIRESFQLNEKKLCARGKSAAKRKFSVYPSAYANMYASAVCSGKVKPGGKKK
jgi:hypothetical protein